MSKLKTSGALAVVGSIVLTAYLFVIRPWQLRWGATDEEVARVMPGDSVVKDPTFNATRAVTVAARPEDIWPWLVQIGFGRAGWYSYDWIDNFGRPSAGRIIPELQGLKVGDLVPLGPGDVAGFWVKALEPNRWMLWGDKKGEVTWFWGLYPQEDGSTRLIARVRMQYNWASLGMLFNIPVDVGDIVMMRKCLLGIKERAEAVAQQSRQGR
ncbi:MAG: hypothetical protein HY675_15585 [Chloroflexi bacterium]|nr:hypothetical protein [Chloroflexota bacterium]